MTKTGGGGPPKKGGGGGRGKGGRRGSGKRNDSGDIGGKGRGGKRRERERGQGGQGRGQGGGQASKDQGRDRPTDSQGHKPERVSEDEIDTVFEHASLRPDHFQEENKLSIKLAYAIAFSAPLSKQCLLRRERCLLLCRCPDETIGANMIRCLTETHALFSRPHIEDVLSGRSLFPEKDVMSVIELLNRAIALCGAGIAIKQPFLTMATMWVPGYTGMVQDILAKLQEEAKRRKELEAEQAERVEEGEPGIGTYSGVPRNEVAALDSIESLRGFGQELARERQGDKPVVEAQYVSVDTQLNTYAALERANFNLPLRTHARAFFSNDQVPDPRDIMCIRKARFSGIHSDLQQSRVQFTITFEHPADSNPVTLEYGRLLVASADMWESSIHLMSLGQMDDVLAKGGRFSGGGRGKGPRPTSKRQGWDSLVVEVLTDTPSVSGVSLDRLLGGSVQLLAFSEPLLPAYLPIIHNLMAKDADDLPFGGVLAGVDDEMPTPKWVRSEDVDVSLLFTTATGEPLPAPKTLNRTMGWEGEVGQGIHRDRTYPVAGGLVCRADPTQMKALRHTHNCAVTLIRGGPGTGKSYTAKLTLEMLLRSHQTQRINGPIVIVTYTNQALDTLLEGILQFTDERSFLRIGGRPRTTDKRILSRSFRECKRDLCVGFGNRKKVFEAYRDKEEAYEIASEVAHTLVVYSRLEHDLTTIISRRIQCHQLSSQERHVVVAMCADYLGDVAVDRRRLRFLRVSDCVIPPQDRRSTDGRARKLFTRLHPVPGLPHMEVLQRIWKLCFDLDCPTEFNELLRLIDSRKALLALWVLGDRTYARTLTEKENDLLKRRSAAAVVQSNRWEGLREGQSAADGLADRIAGIDVSSPPHQGETGSDSEGDLEEEGLYEGDESDESAGEDSERSDSDDAVYMDQQYHRDIYDTVHDMRMDTVEGRLPNEQPNPLPDQPWALKPHQVQQWILHSLQVRKEGQLSTQTRGGLTIGDTTRGSGVLDHLQTLQASVDKLRREQDDGLLQGLRHSRIPIFAFTSTAAARYLHVLQGLQPSVMLVEEAGELTESQLIACMPKSLQHIILIGDEQQLRPKVEYEVQGDPTNFDWSMFERLTRMGLQRVQLATQYRMRPEICDLINYVFDQRLQTAGEAAKIQGAYPTLPQPVFFLQHKHKETAGGGGSRSFTNEYEASMIVNLIPVLCNNGFKPSDITIISLYKGQMFDIKAKVEGLREKLAKIQAKTPSRQVLGSPLSTLSDVGVVCLDDYQGQENKVVLVSLCRSKRLGFTSLRNRALVTLSRAKEVLIVFGHSRMYGVQSPSEEWRLVHEYFSQSTSPLVGIGPSIRLGCQTHGTSLDYASPDQLDLSSGWALGGCGRKCGQRLRCGHTCPLPCHGNTPHTAEGGFFCKQRCTMSCPEGHQCKGVCSKCQNGSCPPCRDTVSHTFPCGHTGRVQCCTTRGRVSLVCKSPCGRLLECGHPCPLPCGHQGPCPQGKCTVKVPAQCPNCRRPFRHQCSLLRAKGPQQLCPHPCVSRLPCKHTCTGTCGNCTKEGSHSACLQRHFRVLGCGHICGGQCGHEGHCHCSTTCDMGTCAHGVCPAPCSEACPSCQATPSIDSRPAWDTGLDAASERERERERERESSSSWDIPAAQRRERERGGRVERVPSGRDVPGPAYRDVPAPAYRSRDEIPLRRDTDTIPLRRDTKGPSPFGGPTMPADTEDYADMQMSPEEQDYADMQMSPEEQEFMRQAMIKQAKKRVYVNYRNEDGTDCYAIGPSSRCFCGHPWRYHVPSDDKAKGRKFSCTCDGCQCRKYNYLPSHGTWEVRCMACKHKAREHDPVTRKCKRCQKCDGFSSTYCCACGQYFNQHHTAFEGVRQRLEAGRAVDPMAMDVLKGDPALGGLIVSNPYESFVPPGQRDTPDNPNRLH
ncbi:protein FAM221A/B [Kipferlia bialata]|uniref:Protein FAM221A/B n=1 Tax=Kipferlia bialata TaxID=797122 RepID=A0A9K3CT04_9EUKA|nr:protein FAM221A/B [Kipferlia bialata]|eukprot:g2934.t1